MAFLICIHSFAAVYKSQEYLHTDLTDPPQRSTDFYGFSIVSNTKNNQERLLNDSLRSLTIFKSSHLQIFKSSNLQIITSSNPQITKSNLHDLITGNGIIMTAIFCFANVKTCKHAECWKHKCRTCECKTR